MLHNQICVYGVKRLSCDTFCSMPWDVGKTTMYYTPPYYALLDTNASSKKDFTTRYNNFESTKHFMFT